jgi:hypothetical protein
MHKATIRSNGYDFTFYDADVCNPDDAIWAGDYNPYNVRLWLIHDHGFVVAVSWASNLQDALDEAADSGKLDSFQVDEADAADYGGDIYNCDSLAYLGNAGEPFDIEALGYIEFAAPPLSLAALFSGVHVDALSERGPA